MKKNFKRVFLWLALSASATSTFAQKISAKLYSTYAIGCDGKLWTWGYNANGQLGNGTTTNSSSPLILSNPTNIIQSSPNGGHSLLLKSDGTVWASGDNRYGELGISNYANQLSFVQVNTITNAIAVATGYDGSYALTNTGNVYSWGENSFGSVGDGTTIHRNVPILLSGLSEIIAIDGSTDNGYALKNDGTVWAWGWNIFGQIGDGTTTQRNVPVQVPGLSNVTAISSNGYHCLALKSDGTVWAWGFNGYGQLGDGTTTNRNIPTQLPGLTNVASISAGYLHSLVVKTDGTVWAWGGNSFGQLGDGTTIDRLTPTLASSLTGTATSVSGGLYSSYAVKNDGTILSWGWNVFGQLGNGTTTDTEVPTLINANINPLPSVSVSGNQTICFGSSATLVATSGSGSTFSWNTGETTPSVTVSPVEQTVYTVTASNSCGSASASTTVNVNTPINVQTTSSSNNSCTGLPTIYLGYGSQTINLTASASGGSGSFTYSWSNGETTQNINVSPTTTTNYTVVVTDEFGCTNSSVITVLVNDIRDNSGKGNNDKVFICHNGHTISVSTNAVPAHLAHGDCLGKCNSSASRLAFSHDENSSIEEEHIALTIYPNPSTGNFTVKSNIDGTYNVINELGQTIQTVKLNASNSFNVNIEGLSKGIYYIIGLDNNTFVKQKLIITE